MLFATPPLPIIDAPADYRHRGGLRPMPPQFIVLHHTGAWPALTWLTTDARSDVSAHRYVEPHGKLYKLVDDHYRANTAGYADVGPWSDAGGRNFNEASLNIEGCFNPAEESQWDSSVVLFMAMQTVEWIGLYGLLPIVYHMQVDARKSDPARFPRGMFDLYVGRGIAEGMRGTLTKWSLLQ